MKKSLLLVISFVVVLGLTVSAQEPNLVGYYKLDETDGTTAADASGNGYDATVNGTATWGTGEIDGALEFDGSTNVILPGWDMGLTSHEGAVSFWVNSGEPSGINTIWSAGDNNTGGGFGPENEMHVHLEAAATDVWAGGEVSFVAVINVVDDETVSTFLFSDPEKGNVAGTPPVNPIQLNDEEWHHVVASWGGGFVGLFIDGETIWDTTQYNPIGYNLDSIFLGSMTGGSRMFTGMLDEVQIFDGPLTSQHVTKLFNKEPIVGINTIGADRFGMDVYPNPATEKITISFKAKSNVNAVATIYDIAGNKVAEFNQWTVVGNNRFNINTTEFNSGMYIAKIEMDNESSYSKVLVK